MKKKTRKPSLGTQLFKAGSHWFQQGKYNQALAALIQSLNYSHNSLPALVLIAQTHERMGRADLAVKLYHQIIKLEPTHQLAQVNLAICWLELGQLDQAQHILTQLHQTNPENPTVNINLGNIFLQRGDTATAIDYYFRALTADPNNSAPYFNLGNIYLNQQQYALAQNQYQKALTLDPTDAAAHNNLGIVLAKLGHPDQALTAHLRAFELNPVHTGALQNIVSLKLSHFDWSGLKSLLLKFKSLTRAELSRRQPPGITPFLCQAIFPQPSLNLQVARAHSLHLAQQQLSPPTTRPLHRPKPQINLGFISDGFYDFPIARNSIRLFELLNRNIFTVTAFSNSVIESTPLSQRVQAAFDRFIPIHDLDTTQTATAISKANIDILIDLNGHTSGNSLSVLATRPAPIQITYLGYPGTTGAQFVDYLIADPLVIPPSQRRFYSEKILYLPDCYRPTDDLDQPGHHSTRPDHKLPEDAFVFASFNHSYKLTPELVKLWQQILSKVPNSVLWQLESNSQTATNLTAFLSSQRLNPNRVIFAPPLSKPDHLARIKLADLCLDTFPVNGHTTTTDTLWMGLPTIALRGKHFASKVSESVLTAIGLPELITSTTNDYQNLAISLANNPNKLTRLKHKLKDHLSTRSLFNISSYTNNFEHLLYKACHSHSPVASS